MVLGDSILPCTNGFRFFAELGVQDTAKKTADHILTACSIYWKPHKSLDLTVPDDKTRCWLHFNTAASYPGGAAVLGSKKINHGQ